MSLRTSSAKRPQAGWMVQRRSAGSWAVRADPDQFQPDRRVGDDEKAVVMYDTDTVPVKDAPGAECVTVRDGKITHMRIIFDRQPFDEARRAAATG
jgi:hypothetical protein